MCDGLKPVAVAILLALILGSGLLAGPVASADTLRVAHAPGHTVSAQRWAVVDLVFEGSVDTKAPFEVPFTARFTGPNGQVLDVPGFYNGGREWIIRFSAPTQGSWAYVTRSSQAALDARSGSVIAGANTNPSQRGALVINPEQPQNFFYEDGTECTVLAFECDWLFALDYDNPSAAPKTEHLLDRLAESGLNQVVTTVYSYDVKWHKDPLLAQNPKHEFGGRDDIYPFAGINKQPDFDALNVEFFQRFDRVVSEMNDRGITAHLMIYVWNKLVAWPPAESDADNRYFDYIIKRYQAFPNVLWDVSKEALNNNAAPRNTAANASSGSGGWMRTTAWSLCTTAVFVSGTR